VIDLRNLSGESTLDWLGSALADTTITYLARAGSRVVSPARIQGLLRRRRIPLDSDSALVALGAELKVRWLITGSFRQAADRIRVALTVTDVFSCNVYSAQIVDGDRNDLFDLEDRVGNVIVADLSNDLKRTEAKFY
jgi:adenylate cyclase